ncbi:nicotinamide N-methyltransferase-like [Ixodes scapularis]
MESFNKTPSTTMNYGHLIEKYRRDFHSRAYPDRLKRVPYVNRFFQRELHDIYTSPSFRGKSLLDVGCGPTVHNVFPATTKIQNVVLSDLCAGNRREVENWIQKTPGAIDCSFISEALAAVEGHVDLQSGAKEIEERTRRAIKKTIPCNILDPNVLSKEHRETFDVVFSSLCLESASLDEQTYQKNTQNIGNLVAPGGYLILCGIAGSLAASAPWSASNLAELAPRDFRIFAEVDGARYVISLNSAVARARRPAGRAVDGAESV